MKKYQFPANFWWGSAASGPQTEGRISGDGKGENIFDYWYKNEPQKFFDQVGPEKTSQVYTKYQEDVQLMKQTGHNSFRTSIQWSRLIPDESGTINEEAVRFYHRYFDELIENGIEPFVNLYHFDMPMYLQEKGGWLNRETVEAYEKYNEPIVPVEAGYLYRWHYPEESDMKKAIQVGYHEALASALAIKAYHEMDQSGVIGIILNLTPSYPRDESNPEDVKAARIADAFFNRSFLDPAVKGEFPSELIERIKELDLMLEIHPDDLAIIKENTVDLLGINYYQPRRIKAKETPIDTKNGPMPEDYFDNYEMPGRKMNPYRGWEIYEKGIYDILINVRDHYGNIDCFISENGMGVENEARFIKEDGMIHDDYRIEFVQSHLKYVHQAIQEGANCLGYHMWTCMDNWSWTNAYKNRYGFISVDLAQDGKRTIKKSGHWFKDVSDRNGFEA
ncbi:glycoside hydrolase family 1 protein [Enterococcus lactis]|uniref:glycoside hydrolase family 1 protein n=1 Tax=Enterococcus lactis TaxID=357441 RepID=UPI00237B0A05|nr:glycoside hydrolase family 1 protein [Enterococcus lactis]